MYNNIISGILLRIGGNTMDNVIDIINCIILILVKNVLDTEYDVMYNNIISGILLRIGGNTMDNVIDIINCIILILVKNVLDTEYLKPL